MKFIYALLMLFISSNAHSTTFDFNGEQGYYELDTSKIDALAIRMIDDESPIHQLWSKVRDKAFRGRLDVDHINDTDLRKMYCNVQEKNGNGRDSVPTWKILKEQNPKNLEETIGILFNILGSEKEREDFLDERALYREKRTQDIMSYDALNLGQWKKATLRNFINKVVLDAFKTSPFPLEERNSLFRSMKETGFLKTTVENVDGYTYSQRIAAEEFLKNHQEVHTLILGCGSFAPASMAIPFFGDQEGGCGCCCDAHSLSKGEMTLSIPADGGFDLSSGYNEEGAASDIIGDFKDSRLWDGIRAGLLGREFDVIKDHSWVGDSTFYCMEAFSVLKEGGLLEIWHPRSQDINDIPWGFVIKDQDEKFLRLIKNSNL